MTSLYTNNWQFCMYVEMTSSQSSAALRLLLRPPSEHSEGQCPWGRPLAGPGALTGGLLENRPSTSRASRVGQPAPLGIAPALDGPGLWTHFIHSNYRNVVLSICLRYHEGSKHMPVAGYRLYGALRQELFGGSLQDSPRPPDEALAHSHAWRVVRVSKIDSGYALTVVTMKLWCVSGKGVIGLSWPSLKVWRQSKFPFRQ